MALIERTRYELTVPIPAATVAAALTDFSRNRPAVWPETSDPKVYRLHALVGPAAAVASAG